MRDRVSANSFLMFLLPISDVLGTQSINAPPRSIYSTTNVTLRIK